MAKESTGIKILGDNRKARFNYEVEETLECGIELKGTEVKSAKAGKLSFSDAYGKIVEGELWLSGLHISPYPFGNLINHDPDRDRRLLAHKEEIARLRRKVDERGYTLIPLRFYLRKGFVKLDLGLCKGKKLYDKRENIKQKDIQREIERDSRIR